MLLGPDEIFQYLGSNLKDFIAIRVCENCLKITLEIRVKTNKPQTKLYISKQNEVMADIQEIPERGKANRKLLKHIQKKMKLTQSDVTLTRGIKSPHKTIELQFNDPTIEDLKIYGQRLLELIKYEHV